MTTTTTFTPVHLTTPGRRYNLAPAHKTDFIFATVHSVTSQSPSLIVTEITILVLAIFLGVEVISKVPTMLHTPLMSGTNAIHGIVIVGAIVLAGSEQTSLLMKILGVVAMILATANVVGGFVVTDRMLEMFKPKKRAPADDEKDGA